MVFFLGGAGLPDSDPWGGGGGSSLPGGGVLFWGGEGGGVLKGRFLDPSSFENPPPSPTSLEIFTGEFGSPKIDQKNKIDQYRPKTIKIDHNPPPFHFYGSFSRGSCRGPVKVTPLTGPRWKRHPPPIFPNSEDSVFGCFFLGGGGAQNQVFVFAGRESCSSPPCRKTAATKNYLSPPRGICLSTAVLGEFLAIWVLRHEIFVILEQSGLVPSTPDMLQTSSIRRHQV